MTVPPVKNYTITNVFVCINVSKRTNVFEFCFIIVSLYAIRAFKLKIDAKNFIVFICIFVETDSIFILPCKFFFLVFLTDLDRLRLFYGFVKWLYIRVLSYGDQRTLKEAPLKLPTLPFAFYFARNLDRSYQRLAVS